MIHKILENPHLYSISQQLLAPGGTQDLKKEIQSLLRLFPPCTHMLDVGCGPQPWLWDTGVLPVGTDLSFLYCREYKLHGQQAVVGSADFLPFATGSFEMVWSIGLMHHLPYPVACQTVAEMDRVAGTTGYCVIFDAALPESIIQRPLAHLIRKGDRGRFMRNQRELESMADKKTRWLFRRISYSWYGLEGIFCIRLPENCSGMVRGKLMDYCHRS